MCLVLSMPGWPRWQYHSSSDSGKGMKEGDGIAWEMWDMGSGDERVSGATRARQGTISMFRKERQCNNVASTTRGD